MISVAVQKAFCVVLAVSRREVALLRTVMDTQYRHLPQSPLIHFPMADELTG